MNISRDIFEIQNESEFNDYCLKTFEFQYQEIEPYKQFVDYLGVSISEISHYKQIPFLPISCFKSFQLINDKDYDLCFESSGTTGQVNSKHFVKDQEVYQKSIRKGFEEFWGDVTSYEFFALLPSYLERNNASLVFMVDYLMELSKQDEKQFYLHNYSDFQEAIEIAKERGKKIMVFGVTYALLELMNQITADFSDVIIIETGGMKGRGKELIRAELHQLIQRKMQCKIISSEYGMTELLSQAYYKEQAFYTPKWMKILARSFDDPLTINDVGRGYLNVIDLANIYSISFIATNDIVNIHANYSFDILGRKDHSDVRGCNLMIL